LNNQGHCSITITRLSVYKKLSTMDSALIDLYDVHFKIMFIEINYILQQKVAVFVF